jgi:hypothetical protein
MQEREQEARLKTYSSVMMSVCHGGRCVGFIFAPPGSFFGKLVPNPLTGPGHDPNMQWFVVSQGSLENGLLGSVKKELAENALNLSMTDLQVGMPKLHIGLPSVLY